MQQSSEETQKMPSPREKSEGGEQVELYKNWTQEFQQVKSEDISENGIKRQSSYQDNGSAIIANAEANEVKKQESVQSEQVQMNEGSAAQTIEISRHLNEGGSQSLPLVTEINSLGGAGVLGASSIAQEDQKTQVNSEEEEILQRQRRGSKQGTLQQRKTSSPRSSNSDNHSQLIQQQQVYQSQQAKGSGNYKPPQNAEFSPTQAQEESKNVNKVTNADQQTARGDLESNAQAEIMKGTQESEQRRIEDEERKSSSSSTWSQEEEEINDPDDQEDYEQAKINMVVEVSPKGRFKRFAEELGRGAYKIVYRGVDNETGREVAWNLVSLNRLPKQDRVRIKSEINLIKGLEHKNIIHFISAWFNKEKEQVIFITEMISGGSLRKYVKKIKNPRLKVIKGWCHEILNGLVYLHEQKPHPIIHRDLKCDNIFINSNSGEIRIGDLGLSTPMTNSYTTSVLGTPEFMAPELYEECYGTSVDIYAFGMCVLEMVTLERPYKECQNPAQIYNKVVQGIRPRALDRIEDDEVKAFILQCLERADKRPSAKQLLESKFLKDLESEKNKHEVRVRPPAKAEKQFKKSAKLQLHKQGSTILEEAEEGTDDEAQVKRQQHQQPQAEQLQASQVPSNQKVDTSQQMPHQPIPSQTTEFDHSSASLLSQAQPQAQQKQPIEPSEQEIKNQIYDMAKDQQVIGAAQVLVGSASQQLPKMDDLVPKIQNSAEDQAKQSPSNSMSNHQSQSSSNHNEQQSFSMPEKKRKNKGDHKNKKLNESFRFLQSIDQEKQKKLMERTMSLMKQDGDEQQYTASNASDGDTQVPEQMMLTELYQSQDAQEAKDMADCQEYSLKYSPKGVNQSPYSQTYQSPPAQNQASSLQQMSLTKAGTLPLISHDSLDSMLLDSKDQTVSQGAHKQSPQLSHNFSNDQMKASDSQGKEPMKAGSNQPQPGANAGNIHHSLSQAQVHHPQKLQAPQVLHSNTPPTQNVAAASGIDSEKKRTDPSCFFEVKKSFKEDQPQAKILANGSTAITSKSLQHLNDTFESKLSNDGDTTSPQQQQPMQAKKNAQVVGTGVQSSYTTGPPTVTVTSQVNTTVVTLDDSKKVITKEMVSAQIITEHGQSAARGQQIQTHSTSSKAQHEQLVSERDQQVHQPPHKLSQQQISYTAERKKEPSYHQQNSDVMLNAPLGNLKGAHGKSHPHVDQHQPQLQQQQQHHHIQGMSQPLTSQNVQDEFDNQSSSSNNNFDSDQDSEVETITLPQHAPQHSQEELLLSHQKGSSNENLILLQGKQHLANTEMKKSSTIPNKMTQPNSNTHFGGMVGGSQPSTFAKQHTASKLIDQDKLCQQKIKQNPNHEAHLNRQGQIPATHSHQAVQQPQQSNHTQSQRITLYAHRQNEGGEGLQGNNYLSCFCIVMGEDGIQSTIKSLENAKSLQILAHQSKWMSVLEPFQKELCFLCLPSNAQAQSSNFKVEPGQSTSSTVSSQAQPQSKGPTKKKEDSHFYPPNSGSAPQLSKQQQQQQKSMPQLVVGPISGVQRDNMIKMKVNLKGSNPNDGSQNKEVSFDFDMLRDTPQGVAQEMVKELQLNPSQVEVIVKEIKRIIGNAKVSQISLSPSDAKPQPQSQAPSQQNIQQLPNPSTAQIASQQPPQLPAKGKAVSQKETHQQAPQKTLQQPAGYQTHQLQLTKQSSQVAETMMQATSQHTEATLPAKQLINSEGKLSSEQANIIFNKVFESLEMHYQYLSSKGLTIEDVVESMESSKEEKAIKFEFLKEVFGAKRVFKKKIQDHNPQCNLQLARARKDQNP